MKKGIKKLLAFLGVTVMCLTLMVGTAFASTTTDLSEVTTALTTNFTVAEIGAIIATVLASGVGFVLLWWGARKLVNAIIGAFKTGKLNF